MAGTSAGASRAGGPGTGGPGLGGPGRGPGRTSGPTPRDADLDPPVLGAPGWTGGSEAAGLDGLVVNERREALLAAASVLRATGAGLATLFDRVATLLADGAWAGRAATAWGVELTRLRGAVGAALDTAAMGCAAVSRAEPDRVARDDPRAVRPAPVTGLPRGAR